MINKQATVKEASDTAIENTNNYFLVTNTPVSINRMDIADLKQCNMRSMISQHRLAWTDYEYTLGDKESYNFCFKLTSSNREDNPVPNRPEAGCICTYNIYDRNVTVELIQNFAHSGGIMDGNMMTYSLMTLFLFLVEIQGNGVYLMSPINRDVRDHYIHVMGFKDVYGNGELLYRSFEKLELWYLNLMGYKTKNRLHAPLG